MCGTESDFSANNKPFTANRVDGELIGSGGGSSDDRFMFTTMSLPSDSKLLPTLGNGHLGFTALSDDVYMNWLYNGRAGLSHRARIPNFVNILLTDCLSRSCKYTLNVKQGIFAVKLTVENEFIATHLVYAHRFYDRALINQIHIQRLGSKDDINLKLQRNPGNDEAPTQPAKKMVLRALHDDDKSNNFHNNEPHIDINNNNFQSTPNAGVKDDLMFTKNETIDVDGARLYLLCGHIRELENGGNGGNEQSEYNEKRQQREEATEEEPARQEEDVCVLWNHVPEEITLKRTASSISYKFAMAVDTQTADVRQEMMNVLRISDDELLNSHIKAWRTFWSGLQIELDGDDELFRAIISSIFYIASSLPPLISHSPQHPFYGLSPTGLGRGGSDLDDYEGHNFWDTEMFMFPPVALIEPSWAKKLLHYRTIMLSAARDNANASGYRGARFPWESAATGIEVIQPGYEYIAEYQQHITGDISFAVRHYLALTHDADFMSAEGCELAVAAAEFWASRATFNESTGLYDINHVMGPNEDMSDIDNNVYTNIIARYALEFGSFAECLCGNNESGDGWIDIAGKIKVLYDSRLDYHPQYEGYEAGTEIKQADTVLIGYPLMFPMNHSTRLNDLSIYVNATRSSGPAMSTSMYAINYLDVDEEIKANAMLAASYKPYVRHPFNVWSEVVEGETGATNFITGAGGFLQTIFNGYGGIRLHLDRLELRKPRLPIGINKLRIKGFSYLNSKFELKLRKRGSFVKFVVLNDELNLRLDDGEQIIIVEKISYNVTGIEITTITSVKSPYGNCKPAT